MAIVTAGTILATGCGKTATYTINSDYSAALSMKTYYTEEELSMAGEKTSDYKKEVKDGKTFYVEEEKVKYSAKEMKDDFASFSKSKIECFLNLDSEDDQDEDDMDMDEIKAMVDFMDMKFEMPKKILKSNGKISSDGKNLSYDLLKFSDDKRMYAAFTKDAYTSKKLTVSGVANKKYYNKTKKIKVSSPCVITSFKVNGQEQEKNTFQASGSKKYKVKIKLLSGKTKELTFTVDKKKPTVNVKAKTYKKAVTLKFSDKLSGIKKATLNGKTIKNKKKVSKKGTYKLKVTDKAGNTTSVKFKIK